MLTQTLVKTGTAVLTGRPTKPELIVSFAYEAIHPGTGTPLREMLKSWPGARYRKSEKNWLVTGTPRNPDAVFQAAGIEVSIDPITMPGVTCLQDVYLPVSRLDANRRTVSIRHRLSGYKDTSFLVGWGSTWDKGDQLFKMPVTDVYMNGKPRPGIQWDQASLEASFTALTSPYTTHPELAETATALGRCLSMGDNAKAWAAEHLPCFPDWFKRDLFPHQLPGAYSAVLGHRLLADPPGVGKSSTAVAAFALLRAKRVILTCPPLLATGWVREIRSCGYPGEVVQFKAGRKEPEIPESGVVIIPDSLITSREALRQQLIDWAPDALIVDEAHRMSNLSSKRTQALLEVSAHVPFQGRIPLTGTPTVRGPEQLVPILEFTGHLGPVFGGADAFLRRFCTRDPFGSFGPKKANLGELNSLLTQFVWVRREKSKVLPFLPKRHITAFELDVDVKPYKEAHAEVIEKVTAWVADFVEENGALPVPEDMLDFSKEHGLEFISKLRVASAITKIPAAKDLIAEHIESDPDNESPLIVWVHHKEVSYALAEQLEESGVRYRMLVGGMSEKVRQEAVDEYQAGNVQVLIASLTAAGVGVTLTRGCESLFVELDWTPAIVTQALDRQHRIGQERNVFGRMMVALGTLDERIQKILHKKQDMSAAVYGDRGGDVAVLADQDLLTAQELLYLLVEGVVSKAAAAV